MRAPAEMLELFRERGLKATPQRECIVRVLHANTVHPTAEAVLLEARREMPMLSLKTVYQALHDLAELGELQTLDLGTGSSRFDPNTERHHHLVCTSCGMVRDLHAHFDGVALDPAELPGFAVSAADVVFRGTCPDCRSTTSTTQPTEEQPPHG